MRYYNHSLNEYDNYVFNSICFDLRKKGKCRHDTPNKSYNWKVLFSIFLTKSYLEDYRTSNGKEIGYIRYMYKEDVRKVKAWEWPSKGFSQGFIYFCSRDYFRHITCLIIMNIITWSTKDIILISNR